jgi:two-component system KDP operon response regulator KdpE
MTLFGLKVLVVDDEIAIRRFLRVALNGQGFIVSEANNGETALQAIVINRPDVVILDLGLPDIDGMEVTKRIREWSKVPIIILSVRDQENDKIFALDAGADDYLTKPFSMGELLARIRTVLRRQSSYISEPVFSIGGLVVDLANRLVKMDGIEIQLTPTEYDILRLLVINAGKVITNRQILKQVWGEGYTDLHILRVNVSNLRHKLEPDPSRPTYIHTEPGVGYRLKIFS